MSYLTTASINAAAPVPQLAPNGILTQLDPVPTTSDWQARAISTYQFARLQASRALPELLATHVSALTGHSIMPADVYMDRDAEVAVVVVDGVVFRARQQQVVILRACVECGVTRFESAPLSSVSDLGYTLSAWNPHCHTCQPEDPADID